MELRRAATVSGRNARRSFLCRRERNAPAGSTDQPGSVAPSRYGPGASSPEISEQPFLRADSIDGRRPCAADCDGQPASPSLSAVQQRECGWNGRGKLHLPFHATESTKQFSGGQTVLLAYTVSKLINNTENVVGSPDPGGAGVIQNYYDLGAERSLSSFDVPQRLVLSYVLDLPFGQGKRYFQGVHGIAGKLVSGWGVDGITTFQSGFPIHVDVGDDLAHAFAGTLRPNFDATACPHGAALGGSAESRLNEWFNTACFVDPPAFTFGNVGRNLPNVRADGINNWDFALFKTTTFGPEGKLGLQFRVEVFNLFNRPQFDFPDNSVDDGPQFGQVSDQANNPRFIQFGLRLTF